MANRRMFSRNIARTDRFLDMASSTQNLYFHLGLEADDDGFVSPRMVMRTLGATDDELKMLIAKNFVIPFESGVVVITDWKENNYIQGDRYKPTIYQGEYSQLDCIQNVYKLDTQVRIGKVRLGEVTNTSPSKTPDDGVFEEFWKAYPRKEGKGAARKAWAKLRAPSSLLSKVLLSIASHVASEQWRKEHGRFIPHPATFINQERWEDEVAPGQVAHKSY